LKIGQNKTKNPLKRPIIASQVQWSGKCQWVFRSATRRESSKSSSRSRSKERSSSDRRKRKRSAKKKKKRLD